LEVDRSFYAPYATEDYVGFLLDPPAPVYSQRRPVPIDSYAQFFRESWWQSEFQRFGHQALKLVPSHDSLMVLGSANRDLVAAEVLRELGADDYDYIVVKAVPLL
jgi:hypothetical protein